MTQLADQHEQETFHKLEVGSGQEVSGPVVSVDISARIDCLRFHLAEYEEILDDLQNKGALLSTKEYCHRRDALKCLIQRTNESISLLLNLK